MAKMKPVSIAVLGLGVLMALFASLMVYGRLQKKTKIPLAKPSDTQLVAVAAFDLSWGTSIDRSMIKMVPYLKESLPSGSFCQPEDLEGRVLLYPVRTQEPIFESVLAPTSIKGGGIAAVVTPKKRAMSVKVDKVIGISGFIHPGNRVDVLVTVNQEGKSSVPVTKTALENVLVLATGPELEVKDGKQQKSTVVEVATLEVTPEEGEKLALAAAEGKIQLSLRNFVDLDSVVTRGATIPALLASCRGREIIEGEKVKPAISSVILIKGSCVSELTF